jgi:uncharacterized protein (TIGR02421 family)
MAVEENSKYKNSIRKLSDRIVEAQRPIRILDAIKWGPEVEADFYAKGAKELPNVDEGYYDDFPLPYEPGDLIQEFQQIGRDVVRYLGQLSPLTKILCRICDEYQAVIRMLAARGTPEFGYLSQQLYGSAHDVFHAGEPTIADLGEMMSEALTNIDGSVIVEEEPKTISGEDAVGILQGHLDRAFGDLDNDVRVILSDGILADAAAGSDYIKLRKEAMFSQQDLKVLEVHEGWVHIGTTINGQNQPFCTFLSKGPPSSTITQEGLAIFMEIFTFQSHPGRLRRLTNRIHAVNLAENGADFLEVYRFFLDQGFAKEECYTLTSRVFRGSTPDGLPFTKDLSYTKGFVQVYNYIMLAVRKGKLDRIPFLFCGKTTLEDIRTLADLEVEGVVAPPLYLPPQFADLNALAAFMCLSNFINSLNLKQVEADYEQIL